MSQEIYRQEKKKRSTFMANRFVRYQQLVQYYGILSSYNVQLLAQICDFSFINHGF